ncbi:MAG: hypothetical protein EB075_13245, partial [Bacteroidetes bacterium]|nr:hypothetical protein [Bacteroidota bacterium]
MPAPSSSSLPSSLPTDLNYSIAMILILGGVFLYQRYADRNALVNHPHYMRGGGSDFLGLGLGLGQENNKLPQGWSYSDVILDDDQQILKQLELAKKQNSPDAQKPMIWIHVEREWNARKWAHFFERGSHDINQPYLYLTIKTIADKCGDHFNIAVIDDDSFSNILPNWNVDMSIIDGPLKRNMRQLALAQLLYHHGGLSVPPSTICVHNLIHMHKHGTAHGRDMYIGQFPNHSEYRFDANALEKSAYQVERVSSKKRFKASPVIMGCVPKSIAMKKLVLFLEQHHGADPDSSEHQFSDHIGAFCQRLFDQKLANMIDGQMLGTRTSKNKPVTIHDLMSSSYLDLNHETLFCIHVPHQEILQMPKYAWFAYLPVAQAIHSDTTIGKWLSKTL